LGFQRLIEFRAIDPAMPALPIGLADRDPPTRSAMADRVGGSRSSVKADRLSGHCRVDCAKLDQALKTQDFVSAAPMDGNPPVRIILRHMLPNFLKPCHRRGDPRHSRHDHRGNVACPSWASASGQPVVSWGVLLQEAQNLRSIATAPWLFLPGLGVVLAVLSLNFLGDGLRDAADPHG
jgi:hypothetical protein